jgi:thiol-disulfide isomerase/thioredoxin
VNFWAAWCAPCKEELPRLRSWEKKLNAEGKSFKLLLFSLDDDARQLEDLMKKEPADGVKSTYWLKDGKEREEWLTAAQVSTDPELPMHLLVDPARSLCGRRRRGDGDYASWLREVMSKVALVTGATALSARDRSGIARLPVGGRLVCATKQGATSTNA